MNRTIETNAEKALSELGKAVTEMTYQDALHYGKALDTLRKLLNSHAEMRDLIESIEGKIQFQRKSREKQETQ